MALLFDMEACCEVHCAKLRVLLAIGTILTAQNRTCKCLDMQIAVRKQNKEKRSQMSNEKGAKEERQNMDSFRKRVHFPLVCHHILKEREKKANLALDLWKLLQGNPDGRTDVFVLSQNRQQMPLSSTVYKYTKSIKVPDFSTRTFALKKEKKRKTLFSAKPEEREGMKM